MLPTARSRQDIQKKARETCTQVSNIWLGDSWQGYPLLSGYSLEESIKRSISYVMQEFRIQRSMSVIKHWNVQKKLEENISGKLNARSLQLK